MARKSYAEMLGDFLREVAALVLVFGFLDRLVNKETPELGWVIAVLGIAGLSLAGGLWFGRKE